MAHFNVFAALSYWVRSHGSEQGGWRSVGRLSCFGQSIWARNTTATTTFTQFVTERWEPSVLGIRSPEANWQNTKSPFARFTSIDKRLGDAIDRVYPEVLADHVGKITRRITNSMPHLISLLQSSSLLDPTAPRPC